MNRFLVSAAVTAISAVLVVSASGCFPSLEKDPDFPKYFTKRIPGNTFQAKVEGDRLYGVDVELKKDGSTYRGRSKIGIIDLRSNGETIEGDMGNGRTELHVTDGPDGLSGKGMIGGGLSHFDLSDDRFSGTIGNCNYDLAKNQDSGVWYEGLSTCNGIGGYTRLALPADFPKLPADERAVMLAVFLGH
jgi:hypothetical protein